MLSDIYSLLREKDMLTGLWTRRAKHSETVTALSYEQHGFYEQAQNMYEQVRFLPISFANFLQKKYSRGYSGCINFKSWSSLHVFGLCM